MQKLFSIRKPLSAVGLLVTLIAASAADAEVQDLGQSGIGEETASVVTVRAEFSVEPSARTGKLSITAEIQDGYHIYATSQPKPFIATRLHIDESDQFVLTGPFTASRTARVHRHESIDVELHELEGAVTWTVPLKLAADVDTDAMRISGYVYAQACNATGCLAPKRFPFTAQFNPTGNGETAADPVEASTLSRGDIGEVDSLGPQQASPAASTDLAQDSAGGLDFSKLESEIPSTSGASLLAVLLTAFAAGFVLNFMPCVLPVIGLKIMSFVQQAGDRRGRIFILNVWYSAGLMSVFLVLATLAVFLGLGWGEQFSSVTFNAILASVVFVFALSFLGVWEIPIPGFVGSGKANQLSDKEGAAGAFSKGVLTTVLATPCSGPMLGPALSWAVSQPPAVAYAGFACVGLGMASPYLLIGAFPRLIGFLPKPGAWMDTFKHMMGFVLLGTVVYLLTFLSIPYVVPTVAFLMGLWATCWWIGRTPLTESLKTKLRAWVAASAFAAMIGIVSFGWLHTVMASRFQRAVDRELSLRNVAVGRSASIVEPESNELPWQPFSKQLLEKLTAEGKTVFIDFTADW